MPVENGEISGFVKMFYGILITLAVCGGLYAIVSGLVLGPNGDGEGSYFENLLSDELLTRVSQKIIGMAEGPTN